MTTQFMLCTRNAIRRIAGFRLIEQLVEKDTNDVALKEIVAWFTSYQNNTTQLVHYTEGLRGCGNFLEERLRSAFFNILTHFSQKL